MIHPRMTAMQGVFLIKRFFVGVLLKCKAKASLAVVWKMGREP